MGALEIVEQLGGIIVFLFRARDGRLCQRVCHFQGRRVRFQLIVDAADQHGCHSPICSFGMI
jgi:hypothetical protein